jgi:hypothetical protein
MSGMNDDEVVQTLSADRADEPLGVWILPGAAGRREDFLDLQRSHTRPNVAAINAVPIPQQIARSVVLGEGLDNRLSARGRADRNTARLIVLKGSLRETVPTDVVGRMIERGEEAEAESMRRMKTEEEPRSCLLIRRPFYPKPTEERRLQSTRGDK